MCSRTIFRDFPLKGTRARQNAICMLDEAKIYGGNSQDQDAGPWDAQEEQF